MINSPPNLSDLPLPPADKSGWPWTEAATDADEFRLDDNDLPQISIVTPSLNQGQFLEETIRSALLQGYPNLEYIVVDGGSTDNSIEIIRKYAVWISHWVSEPDNGQAHAINKGFKRSGGQILGWLNSDDVYHPKGITTLIQIYKQFPKCSAWIGASQEIDAAGKPLRRLSPRAGTKRQIANWGTGHDAHFHQPSCLFDAKAFFKAGGLNEDLQIAIDVDLWLRLVELGDFALIDEVVSFPRIYPQAKSHRDLAAVFAEHVAINFNHGMPDLARHMLKRYVRRTIYGEP
jgi:glycosyltransferase involved in cell wall biosynthesis